MITPSFGLTATERVLPKLALDFTTASLDSRITFTRTTDATHPATYVNSSGYVTAATNNQPRFDYDPVTLACKGLLIEESRANLLTYSNGFENTTPWPQTNVTVSSAAATSPDGTNNACKIEETSANGTHGLVTASISFTQNVANTFSVYAKKGERNIITLAVAGVSGVSFNLATGASGSTFTNANWSTPTYSITDCGNGFYRCTATFTRLATTTSTTIYLNLSDNASSLPTSIDSYVGTTGYGVYVYGAQLEVGAFPTSYIPTTTAALTRNADVATMTGTNFSDWFNASEGTFAAEFQLQSTSQVSISMLSANAGSINNRYEIGLRSTGTNVSVVTTSSATVAILDFGAPTTAITNQTLAYKENSFAGAKNGGTVSTDTAGALPTVNSLNIGSRANDAFCNGWLRAVNYWPLRVTNSEAQAFSKG